MVYKAKKKDIKSLELLLKELFSQEKEFKYKKGLHAKALEKILKKKKVGRIFVYKIEDKIVGMVSLLYSYSTALGAKVGGSALLEHLIEYANKKGLKRLTLLTDADNELAQKMYGKFGFKHSEMIVLRKGL